MPPRIRAWGRYLLISLPIGAAIGAVVGEAIDRIAVWSAAGALAGAALSLWLAYTTTPDDDV